MSPIHSSLKIALVPFVALALALPIAAMAGEAAAGQAPKTAAASATPATVAGPAPDASSQLCDLGITFALSGRSAAAESAFVALLSRSPGDPRALNNLGNLHLWRGAPAVAMAFYRAAAVADTTDAGIVLNGAAALLAAGEDDGAREQAAAGVRLAGGVAPAAGLLGLSDDQPDSLADRGADRTRMSREQALSLLRSAVRAVPVDSVRHAAADSSRAPDRHAPTWRSAGVRGSRAADAPAVVYWKR